MRSSDNCCTLGGVSDVWPTKCEVPTRPPALAPARPADSRSTPVGPQRGSRLAIVIAVLTGILGGSLLTAAVHRESASPRSEQLSKQEKTDLLARAQVSTVRVAARACPGVTHGSGFVIDGLLFTSGHVAATDQRLKVDRPGQPVESPVVATSVSLDVAVADGSGLVAVEMALVHDPVPEGETVFIAGFPGGGELVANQARVVTYAPAPEWGVQGRRVMVLEPGVQAGFSGGPVLNRDGELIGMLAGVDLVTGLAIAIPGDELASVVDLAVQTWGPAAVNNAADVVTHIAPSCGG